MSKKKPAIPNFGLPIHETHCHLDYLESQALADALAAARAVGVDKVLTIAVSPDNLDKALNIAKQCEGVYCTQGIHPHEAKDFDEGVERRIREHIEQDRLDQAGLIRAVGEIGLDYYYDHSDHSSQREAFERQLQIAIDANLPVVIHARDADEDTAAILKNFAANMPQKGVIHSFTASQSLAETCLDLGFHLGFNGIITFNKAENVRSVLEMTPLEKVLLETDAPYLTPVPYRGTTNEPRFLPFIAAKVSEVKGVDVQTVIQQTTRNAEALFWA